MKTLLLSLMLLFVAAPCLAAPCGDTQNAATTAIKERNARVKETHNTTMPDPEEDRGPLSNCLGSIASIGDAFSLGVSIPSMDSIINGMCRQVDSMIQSKMNEVLSEARSSIAQIGRNNPFQVSGSGSDVAGSLIRKLK